MDYKEAYAELSAALWQYDKARNDAYVQLMLAVNAIDKKINNQPPPLALPRPTD